MRNLAAASLACLVFLGGCTFSSILSKLSTKPAPAPATVGPVAPSAPVAAVAHAALEAPSRSLGIPPEQLPSPGECRLWLPDIPPARQSAPGSCVSVQKKVPAGAWVLHRSDEKSNEVAVNVYRSRWPLIVSETRYFDYWTGGFLRAE